MAPQEASVVMVAKSVEEAMPKRISLPSMLPPGWASAHSCAVWLTPIVVRLRVAGLLRAQRDEGAEQEDQADGGEERPALLGVARAILPNM